jgi:hypothetical protein
MQQANVSTSETLVTIPARFDGKQIKLDVAYPLPANARLLVTVLQADSEKVNRQKYARLLALRGKFANDEQYDEVLREMDAMWQSWKLESV